MKLPFKHDWIIFQAQFYVFDKIKTEGGFQRIEEVHLRSEVLVPRSMIGRIIGKGGQNVSVSCILEWFEHYLIVELYK